MIEKIDLTPSVLNDKNFEIKKGIISSIMSKDDYLYAMIREDSDSFLRRGDEGEVVFNSNPFNLRSMLYIKTDIRVTAFVDPRDYLNSSCNVYVKNGIAYYAELCSINDVSIFGKKYLSALSRLDPNSDLFSDKNMKLMKHDGFTIEEINALKSSVVSEEELKGGKVVTVVDQATWWQDSVKDMKDVVLLDRKISNTIFPFMNEKRLKTKECQKPSSIFSAR